MIAAGPKALKGTDMDPLGDFGGFVVVACLRNSRDSVEIVIAVGVHAWTLLMQTLEGLYPISDVPLWQHLHFTFSSWCPVQKYVYSDGQLLFSFSFSILECSTNPAYEVACKAG